MDFPKRLHRAHIDPPSLLFLYFYYRAVRATRPHRVAEKRHARRVLWIITIYGVNMTPGAATRMPPPPLPPSAGGVYTERYTRAPDASDIARWNGPAAS